MLWMTTVCRRAQASRCLRSSRGSKRASDVESSAPGWVAEPGGLDRYDHLTDRPQRKTGQFQVRPGERDSHDCQGEQDGDDEVPERQPPAGENQPHEVAEDPERAGADVLSPEILRTRNGLLAEREQRVDGD